MPPYHLQNNEEMEAYFNRMIKYFLRSLVKKVKNPPEFIYYIFSELTELRSNNVMKLSISILKFCMVP